MEIRFDVFGKSSVFRESIVYDVCVCSLKESRTFGTVGKNSLIKGNKMKHFHCEFIYRILAPLVSFPLGKKPDLFLSSNRTLEHRDVYRNSQTPM